MVKQKKDKLAKHISKENPVRSVVKAITWRVIASAITFIVVFVIFRRYSEKSFNEVLQTASFIAIVELIAKILFYYLHERLWTNIAWGKAWKRNYWQRNAWKKLYRQMH
ncbi:MAG: DUF2061 domain-containing protein [Bacteroidota bacterium]|nr:DUF2061 domain-containing protein [Bacteroidota bacterium]